MRGLLSFPKLLPCCHDKPQSLVMWLLEFVFQLSSVELGLWEADSSPGQKNRGKTTVGWDSRGTQISALVSRVGSPQNALSCLHHLHPC